MIIPDDILDLEWIKINIYIYLKLRSNRNDELSVSMREIANEFGITRPTANRYLVELSNLGVVFINGHQTDTKRTLISFKHKRLYVVCGHQTDTKRTLEDRKQVFYDALIPFLDKYDKTMVRDFFNYWSQVNEGGRKMHFEKQKTFEISKRLATWKRNEEERKRPQRTEDIGVVLEKVKNKFDNEEEF